MHFIRVIYSLGKSLLRGALGSLPVNMPLKKMSLYISPTIINHKLHMNSQGDSGLHKLLAPVQLCVDKSNLEQIFSR